MPNVKWKYGVLWTLVLQGLISGIRAGPGKKFETKNLSIRHKFDLFRWPSQMGLARPVQHKEITLRNRN